MNSAVLSFSGNAQLGSTRYGNVYEEGSDTYSIGVVPFC